MMFEHEALLEHEVLSEKEYRMYSHHYEGVGKRNDWKEVIESPASDLYTFHYEDGVDIVYHRGLYPFLYVKYPDGYIVFPSYHTSAAFADAVTKACGMDVMTREVKIMNGECGVAK